MDSFRSVIEPVFLLLLFCFFFFQAEDGIRDSPVTGVQTCALPILAIGVSPQFTNDRTIFAGTGRNGIFRSVDGGDTWEEITRGLYANFVSTITFSPDYSRDQTVFIGTPQDRKSVV